MSEIERQAGTAAILQLAPGMRRAALATVAAIGPAQGAPFHRHRNLPNAPFRKASIQSRAAIGAHTALDPMPDLRVLLHATNL